MNNPKELFDSEKNPQGRWGVYESIDSTIKGGYVDSKYPRVQGAGSKVLAKALQNSLDNFQDLDELWHVFLDHIRKHEFAEEISRQIKSIKDEMVSSIKHDCEGDLRRRAFDEVKNSLKSEVSEQLRTEFRMQLAPTIEAEVKSKLTQELSTTLRPYVTREIRNELEPKIREEIKAQLLEDSNLRSEVINEIKMRLVGL